MEAFVEAFQRSGESPQRGKFLSRLFGIFSEEIVRLWTADVRAPYEDLGRPRLKRAGELTGHTLDFALRHRATGHVLVAEMKCEIEYENFRYMVLSKVDQLAHHRKPAFSAFLEAASGAGDFQCYVKRELQPVHGAILIWGAATPEGRAAVMQAHKFAEVLCVADIIEDLRRWRSSGFQSLLDERRRWADELFQYLRPE